MARSKTDSDFHGKTLSEIQRSIRRHLHHTQAIPAFFATRNDWYMATAHAVRDLLKVKVDGVEKDAEAVVWWQPWRKPEPYQLTSWNWK